MITITIKEYIEAVFNSFDGLTGTFTFSIGTDDGKHVSSDSKNRVSFTIQNINLGDKK